MRSEGLSSANFRWGWRARREGRSCRKPIIGPTGVEQTMRERGLRAPISPHRLLLVFADGIGLGDEVADNPFAGEPTPALRALLGGPLTRTRVQRREGVALAALDACLGVPG